MESIKNTFISSTFWTESLGPTAALKTLEVMEKKKSWEYITNLGKYITSKWKKLARKNKIKIKKNININCISPGFIKTAMTDKIDEKFKEAIISKIPSARLGCLLYTSDAADE